MKKGESSWDASREYVVIHEKTHPAEWVLAVAFVVATFVIMTAIRFAIVGSD